MPSSIRHFKDAELLLQSFIQDLSLLDPLLAKVPYGRHRPSKLFKHLKRGLPRTPNPKPIVFPSLIAIVPADDDLTGKTLEVVGTVIVWRILHGVLYSELLHCEVGEAIDLVEDPEGLLGIALRSSLVVGG